VTWHSYILFLLHFGAIGAIIGVGLKTGNVSEEDYQGILPYNLTRGGDLGELAKNIEIVGILVAISLLLSIAYFQLMKMFTAALIYLGIGFSILSFLPLLCTVSSVINLLVPSFQLYLLSSWLSTSS